MPTSAAPDDVYRHGLRLLLDKDIPGWVDLWDEEGVLEFPFAPEGWPRRLQGRAAVAEYMRGYPDHIDLHDFPYVEVHQTTDPDRIVVEMRGVGRLVESGGPFDMSYIAVITVKNGRITHCRDYWNPFGAMDPSADFRGDDR